MELKITRRFSVVYQLDTNKINNTGCQKHTQNHKKS